MTAKRPSHENVADDLSIEYPGLDGEPMAENDAQLTATLEAVSMLREWYSDREDVYAGGNMPIYYQINDNKTRVAPGVFVVLGTEKRKRDSWIVWREGKAPGIVMELTPGSSWQWDIRERRGIYAEMGVIEYWRFDPASNYFLPPLIGERLGDDKYTTIGLTTSREGILRGHSDVLGLDICVLPDGNMRFHDPASRHWLRSRSEREAVVRASEAILLEAEASLGKEATAKQVVNAELRLLREELRALQSGQ